MSSVFAGRQRAGSRLNTVYDVDGNEIEVDVREDEEQNVKLTQTVELLLAAGYFRARIKGLSPFDKVVGGMTWCITTCNFDLDVDLLFQENSTIGQKISLTEKIVAVLPKMKCPHRIEPHQIQGLDFIHIYPVVQWLVKRAIETKEELGDYTRQYSISQFQKNHKTPEDRAFENLKEKAIKTVEDIKTVYKPHRKYKRDNANNITDEEIRVHSTLLEYGRRYGHSKTAKQEDDKMSKKKAELSGLHKTDEEEQDLQEEEEKRIQALMSGMSVMGRQGKLTASDVGNIVGLKSDEIQQIASEYQDKQAEIEQLGQNDRVGSSQQHKRVTASLQKQIQQKQGRIEEVQTKHDQLQQENERVKEKVNQSLAHSSRIDQEMDKLSEMETEENQGVLQALRDLVGLNEKLRKQEQDFRTQCKEERSRLQEEIEKLKTDSGQSGDSEEMERNKMIQKQYESDKEKLQKIRLVMARKNREIAGLQRKIDEVPSRAELSQYQRRFVELYNQVAAKHTETKQFYTLYNTLDDTKLYLNKEVNLLNSIHDNFEQAMSSQSNKEQFLKQFEQIVDGVRQNKTKLEKKKQEEKMRRDQLNDHHLDLVEKQRLYFKTVKEFKEECSKNEILLSKMKG